MLFSVGESARRRRVIGVFPMAESCVRLETCYPMEFSEDCRSDRSYVKREKVQDVMQDTRTFLTDQAAS